MKLCDLLETDKILIDIDISSKEEAINKLTDLFKKDSRVIDIDYLKRAVFEREKIMSTGVGLGFAIPHAKTNAVNNVIAAFARSNKSIDFNLLTASL